MLSNIQAIRALAVYLIVLRHVLDSWNNYTGAHFGRPIEMPGGFSQLFFVVSGYVISESVRGRSVSPQMFLRKRLIRIVPLYWIVTLLVFASTLFGFRTFGLHSPDITYLLRSMFFLPVFENGAVAAPIVFVGWTLNYQVFLYVLFAVSLATQPVIAKEVTFLFVAAAILLGRNAIANREFSYFASEILLVFYFGIVTSWFVHRSPAFLSRRSIGFFVSCLVAGTILLVGFAIYLSGSWLNHMQILIGSAATLIVVGAVGLELKGLAVNASWVLEQGTASYSIFLVHPLVLQLAGKAIILTGLNATIPYLLTSYAAMFVLIGAAGVIVHRIVERPLHRMISAVLLKPALAVRKAT